MTIKIATWNVRNLAMHLLLALACALASTASHSAPCLGPRPAAAAVQDILGASRLDVHFAPSVRVNCLTQRAPYPPQLQSTSTVLIYVSVTITALWRREKSLEQLIAEARGVRKNPNRWLGKVLGTAPAKRQFATQHPTTPFKGKQAAPHSQNTGTKHATVRRSRYL